uniref:Neprosin PEP catalytic domain-containing protein n=1 Tax=Oryza punctata TaxID=4537 RepID=A0A0E0LEU9_ORYPU
MATNLSISLVFLSCVVLLLHSGNGSRDCGAAGQTMLCNRLINRSNWRKQLNSDDSDDSLSRYAVGYRTYSKEEGYYGFRATMDVYALSLSPGQLGSYSLIWIETYDSEDNVVDAIRIGSSNVSIGCPGFQLEKGAPAHPNDPITRVSHPNGDKQYINLKVLKDNTSGDWLVYYGFNKDPQLIGHFPKSLFTSLADKATEIWFGGMAVTNATFQPTPSVTPMGSGYMPADNTNMAASMSNLELIDKQGRPWPADENLHDFTNIEDLYTVSPVASSKFFYGGPSTSSASTSCTHAIYSFLLVLLTYYLI